MIIDTENELDLEHDEGRLKDMLKALLCGSEEDVRNCIKYCMLTPGQRAMVDDVAKRDAAEAKFEDQLRRVDEATSDRLKYTKGRIEYGLKKEGVVIKLSDFLAGRDNFVFVFSVMSGCSYDKAEKLLRRYTGETGIGNYCCSGGTRVWRDLPGYAGIAVEYASVQKERESIEEFKARSAWRKFGGDGFELPFPLGVDVAGRDQILDLSAFSVLSMFRCDISLQDEFLVPRLKALYEVRGDVEFHYIGCGSRSVLPGSFWMNLGEDKEMPNLDGIRDVGEFIKWCDACLATLKVIEEKVAARKWLFKDADVSTIEEYAAKFGQRLDQIIVVAQNLPEPSAWDEEEAQEKAQEVLDRIQRLAEPGCRDLGFHYLVLGRIFDHASVRDWIGGCLDPCLVGANTGVIIHQGRLSWGGSGAVFCKTLCCPEALRNLGAPYFIYRSPDNEVYGIRNFNECCV